MITSYYTIEKIVLLTRKKELYERYPHIPYFYYCVLRGPNGGKILVDEYNIERIIRNTINENQEIFTKYKLWGICDSIGVLKNYGNKTDKIYIKTLTKEELNKKKVDDYRYILDEDKKIKKRLIRNRNETLYNSIVNRFRFEV